jgi:hypothetical protein
MLRWSLFSTMTFLLGSEVNTMIDAAVKGESLTDRGVWIGLVVLLVCLTVWFAKVQFNKEAKLTELLAKLTEKSTSATQENTLALQALKMSLDVLANEVHESYNRRRERAS